MITQIIWAYVLVHAQLGAADEGALLPAAEEEEEEDAFLTHSPMSGIAVMVRSMGDLCRVMFAIHRWNTSMSGVFLRLVRSQNS